MQLLHEGLERSEILYSNFPVTKLSPRGRAFCIHLALHLLGLQCAHELLQEVPLHLQNVNVSAEKGGRQCPLLQDVPGCMGNDHMIGDLQDSGQSDCVMSR